MYILYLRLITFNSGEFLTIQKYQRLAIASSFTSIFVVLNKYYTLCVFFDVGISLYLNDRYFYSQMFFSAFLWQLFGIASSGVLKYLLLIPLAIELYYRFYRDVLIASLLFIPFFEYLLGVFILLSSLVSLLNGVNVKTFIWFLVRSFTYFILLWIMYWGEINMQFLGNFWK